MTYIQEDCWKLIKQYAITWNPRFKYNTCNFYRTFEYDYDGEIDIQMVEIESHIFFIGDNNAVIINISQDHYYINLLTYKLNDNLFSYNFEDTFTDLFQSPNNSIDEDDVSNNIFSFEEQYNNVDLMLFYNFIRDNYRKALTSWHEVNWFYHEHLLPQNWLQEFTKWKEQHSRIVTMKQMFALIDYHFIYFDNNIYVAEVKTKIKKLIKSLGLLG
jgi:hypothetical protein